MCLPSIISQKPHLLSKVEEYFFNENSGLCKQETGSELKICVLYALLQSGEVDTIKRVATHCKCINEAFPKPSEVAQGLQVLHLLVRDRLKASHA